MILLYRSPWLTNLIDTASREFPTSSLAESIMLVFAIRNNQIIQADRRTRLS